MVVVTVVRVETLQAPAASGLWLAKAGSHFGFSDHPILGEGPPLPGGRLLLFSLLLDSFCFSQHREDRFRVMSSDKLSMASRFQRALNW